MRDPCYSKSCATFLFDRHGHKKRTAESVSLISDREPLASIEDGKLVFSPESDGEVAFVNSGNRSIIISSIVVYYIQPITSADPHGLRADSTEAERRDCKENKIVACIAILLKWH
jgi:hypothetical protein